MGNLTRKHPEARQDKAATEPETAGPALGVQLSEGEIYSLARRARWLRMLIVRVEEDYLALLGARFVTAAPGITEFESIPVLLDMAEQVSTELKDFADGLEAGLGAA